MPVPSDQRTAGLAALRARLETHKKARVGRVSIIFSLDVELDTGRRFKNLEFIDWSNPNAFADFGGRVEFEGHKAITTAIRDHWREGRATYSMDRGGRILKHTPPHPRTELLRKPITKTAEAIKSE